jgi:uncharacterized protein (TIGR00297 family)
MALFALPLRFLDWPQAATLAFAALVFNLVALRRVAPTILRSTDDFGARAGVIFYPLSILALVLLLPGRLDIVAAAWGIMAFGDGAATLAGTMRGGARLPWNPRKSWIGLGAFIIAGGAGAVALSRWVAPAVEPQPPLAFSLLAPLVAAVVAAFVETLPIELDDNITVPAAAAGTLWFLSYTTWIGPLDSLGRDLAIGFVITLPVAALAYLKGRLTRGGAATGLLLAAPIYAAMYLAGLVVVGTALATTIAASRVSARRAGMSGTEEGGERRGVGNVLANCLVGTLGAVLELFSWEWGLELTAIWFVAGFAAGASDTVASEIGRTFGGHPRRVPSGAVVAPGTPGAISVVGTAAGVAAAAAIAAPAALLWLIEWKDVLAIAAACTAGAFVESALATRFEESQVLDNHTLNFLNTSVAAGLALWWAGA